MIDYEKPKTRRGLWKKTEQPGYIKRKCAVEGCVFIVKCIKCGEFY